MNYQDQLKIRRTRLQHCMSWREGSSINSDCSISSLLSSAPTDVYSFSKKPEETAGCLWYALVCFISSFVVFSLNQEQSKSHLQLVFITALVGIKYPATRSSINYSNPVWTKWTKPVSAWHRHQWDVSLCLKDRSKTGNIDACKTMLG